LILSFCEFGEKTEAAARPQGLQTVRLVLETPSEVELARLISARDASG